MQYNPQCREIPAEQYKREIYKRAILIALAALAWFSAPGQNFPPADFQTYSSKNQSDDNSLEPYKSSVIFSIKFFP